MNGLSSAVINGFELAHGQIFVVMDADRSHDEKILPDLVKAVEQGADLAVVQDAFPRRSGFGHGTENSPVP